MASKSQELRRLMKKQKQTSKKINHPLAKYNNLDQIVCIVCNCVIKNEIIWNAHLQSRKHKENIVSLKSSSEIKKDTSAIKKNKTTIVSSEGEPPSKKSKGTLPDNFFDEPKEKKGDDKVDKKNKESQNSKGQLPKGFFDSANEQSKNITESKNDNDDKSKDAEESESDNKKRKSSASNETLPEGFFDDPKKDAKARKVEYVDPQDLEWEKFQKMIQEETKVADEIRDEEDEEAEMMKDMAEYNNMKSCLSRVEALKSLVKNQQQTNSKSESKIPDNNEIDGNVSSDDDIDGLFDWRAKMA